MVERMVVQMDARMVDQRDGMRALSRVEQMGRPRVV
jgi:hypothetical protein